MTTWTQGNLFDAFGKVIYTDDLGYSVLPKEKSENYLFVTPTKTYTIKDLYVRLPEGRFTSLENVELPIREIAFTMPLYDCRSFIKNDFFEIDLQALTYQVMAPVLTSLDDLAVKSSKWKKASFEMSFQNKDDLNANNLWTFDAGIKEAFRSLHYNEEKDGCYYLIGVGQCRVTETYTYLERDGAMCTVEIADGTCLRVAAGDKNFITTPATFDAAKTKSETAFFSEQLNESELLPYADIRKNGTTVFWKAVPNATEYVLEVYRLIEGKFGPSPYPVAQYKTTFDQLYYYLSNEVLSPIGTPIIYRVIAKSASGETLAFSRGIEKGYPKYFD